MGFKNRWDSNATLETEKKVYLMNSVLMKVTDGIAEIIINNDDSKLITLVKGEIIYIERGRHITLIHNKKRPSDCVRTIELFEWLLRDMFLIMSHLSLVKLQGTRFISKSYYSIMERKNLAHIIDDFSEIKILTCDTDRKEFTHSIYYVISFFIKLPGFTDSLVRSMKKSYAEKIYGMMISDVTKKWSLQMCSKELHTSASTLKRKLEAEETSFRRIYLDARMSISLTLLRTTSKSISSIAHESGFSSCSSFSTTFSKYFGISPKRERGKCKNIYSNSRRTLSR